MGESISATLAEDEFSVEMLQEVDLIIAKYRKKPGSLIPVLEESQTVTGYLPESVQRRVARGLGIPLSQVYGVVTFYSLFTMEPRGKHQIRVCMGTACHVKGGHKVVEVIEEELGIKAGQCTEDREFSIDIVRCLGCCALAPVMVADEKIYGHIKTTQIKKLLKKCE